LVGVDPWVFAGIIALSINEESKITINE
jgi:hypothetical protein